MYNCIIISVHIYIRTTPGAQKRGTGTTPTSRGKLFSEPLFAPKNTMENFFPADSRPTHFAHKNMNAIIPFYAGYVHVSFFTRENFLKPLTFFLKIVS